MSPKGHFRDLGDDNFLTAEELSKEYDIPLDELIRLLESDEIHGIEGADTWFATHRDVKQYKCQHSRVGLEVDGKRVLRVTGDMVIPSTLCPDCGKWVPQEEVDRIRSQE